MSQPARENKESFEGPPPRAEEVDGYVYAGNLPDGTTVEIGIAGWLGGSWKLFDKLDKEPSAIGTLLQGANETFFQPPSDNPYLRYELEKVQPEPYLLNGKWVQFVARQVAPITTDFSRRTRKTGGWSAK